MTRRGATLVEVLVAVAVMGCFGLVVLELVNLGRRSTAKAGQLQVGSLVGISIMDELAGRGYENVAGLPQEVSFSLDADDTTYQVKTRIEVAKPGLLRLEVSLSTGRESPLVLVRLMRDPLKAMDR